MKEKIIQFGEGGFLRGFVDWMVQIANEKTEFSGSFGISDGEPFGYMPAERLLLSAQPYMQQVKSNIARHKTLFKTDFAFIF